MIEQLKIEIRIDELWGREKKTTINCPNELAIAYKVNEIIDYVNQNEQTLKGKKGSK